MKKIILFCLVLLCCTAWGTMSSNDSQPTFSDTNPKVYLTFPNQVPTTVFYGETLRIPLKMSFTNLWIDKKWHIPSGSRLENVSGYCPALIGDRATYWQGTCNMNLIIQGDSFKTVEGVLYYHVSGKDGRWPNTHDWSSHIYSPPFSVKVIPHPLSISPIPPQQATANLNFYYDLRNAINYYDENMMAQIPAEGEMNPDEWVQLNALGLNFNPTNFTVTGIPRHTGEYAFQIKAKNSKGTTDPITLLIEVHPNPKDTPVFKEHYSIPSALAAQKYSMNLMDLLKPNTGFMINNQVTFRFDSHSKKPEWLDISNESSTHLKGIAPKGLAGQAVEFTLIASSNTGGDSEPFEIKIPIAYDPQKKPIIEFFEMEQTAGSQLNQDLSEYIKDPDQDPELKVILDKIEPGVPWLYIDPSTPTRLKGEIPDQATGQKYQITLRAITSVGGSSNPITVPLQIRTDKSKIPRFKNDAPILPMVYPGQSFFYDFSENKDVYPEYEDAPYNIQFAEGYEHPNWLTLKDNRLTAEYVPENMDSNITIYLVIKNIPGGVSHAIPLRLVVMN